MALTPYPTAASLVARQRHLPAVGLRRTKASPSPLPMAFVVWKSSKARSRVRAFMPDV